MRLSYHWIWDSIWYTIRQRRGLNITNYRGYTLYLDWCHLFTFIMWANKLAKFILMVHVHAQINTHSSGENSITEMGDMWHGHLLRILLKMRSKLSCFVKMIGNEYQSVPTDCFCQCSWNTVPIVWVFFTKWLLLWFMNAWFVIRALGVNNSWKRCYLRKERKMKQGRESWYTEQARCYILQELEFTSLSTYFKMRLK